MGTVIKNLEKYYQKSFQTGKEQFPSSGLGSTALSLAAGTSDLGLDSLESAQIQQWVEYVSVYDDQTQASAVAHYILKELDGTLARRTYIASSRKTLADIIIFFSLWNVVASLTYQEKEKYLNLSRWFDNIQKDETIKNICKQIPFSRTLLY